MMPMNGLIDDCIISIRAIDQKSLTIKEKMIPVRVAFGTKIMLAILTAFDRHWEEQGLPKEGVGTSVVTYLAIVASKMINMPKETTCA